MRRTNISVFVGVCLLVVGVARGDGFLDRAQAGYGTTEERRTELVLLPVVGAMDMPPAVVADVSSARLFAADGPGWEAAKAWAEGDRQRAVLAALDQVTREEDYRFAHVFGQGYGEAGATKGAVERGLFSALAGDGLLAGARFGYLDGLDRVASLVHVEATRLAAAGDPRGALDVLTDWLFLCRQICDRAFWAEARWGYLGAASALERMRDVVYVDRGLDGNGARALTAEDLSEVIARLAEDGYLGLDRLVLPVGERIAAEQVCERVLPRAGEEADGGKFAAEMATLGASERPLRLFGEAGRWVGVVENHGDWGETVAELNRIYGDLEARWSAPPHSALLGGTTAMSGLSKKRFAVLEEVLRRGGKSVEEAEGLRDLLRVEAVGTRHALGVVGYLYRFGGYPRNMSAIRPVWVKQIEVDAWNPNVGNRNVPPLEFFVPVRDTRARREPHEMKIKVAGFEEALEFSFGDEEFVMYSVGADGTKDWARVVENVVVPKRSGTDYLIWPPVMSLVREELGR